MRLWNNFDILASPEETKQSIINSLRDGTTLAQQISILQNKLQADKFTTEKNRKIIYNDLTAALSQMFPLHQIHFFGSCITGLDFQGSDLDVYIANVRQRFKPEVMTLKTIRMLIYKSKKFCDVLLISGAKVPIIKCIHTRTQICCDLNVRNRLSVANSELIKYYMTLDEKLHSLMITIKFWAEWCGIKKVNLFSGYALHLMVIFYLQQEPYNIPTVVNLQENFPNDVTEDGWNCGFAPIQPVYINPALKKATILELVAGFFKFYSNFDYISQVICPYFGKALNKIAFINPCSLPNCFKAYKTVSSHNQGQLNVNSSICIQDPFEHSRNVASSVKNQCVGKYAALCRLGSQIISHPDTDLLHQLLLKSRTISMHEFTFELERTPQNDADEDDKKKWFELVKNLTVKTLKEIIRCQTLIISESVDRLTYDCAGQHNIWDNRMSIMKNLFSQLPPETNDIEREIAASACIIKYFPQVLLSKLYVTLYFKMNPCRVQIITRLKSKCKNFPYVSYYLRVKLPQWLKILENEAELPRKGNSIIQYSTSNMDIFETADQNTISAKNLATIKMIKEDDKISGENIVRTDSSPNKQVDSISDSPQLKQKTSRLPLTNLVVTDNVKTSRQCVSENSRNDDNNHKLEEEGELLDEDEEEEDVPADFFDDFSNQDFMDGLDIVDAWDDESGKPAGDTTQLQKEDRKFDKLEKKTHSPIRFATKQTNRKSLEKRSKYGRSRSRSPVKRRKRSSSYGRRPRSKSRSRDKNRVFDARRDPEKTKRDINKDKMKCAKDKEQKMVTDKLKIVETGLVPPGTEMDVDISTIIKDKHPAGDTSSMVKDKRSTGGSTEKSRDSKTDRDRRYPRRSSSREVRKPLRYSRSPPVYRFRNRDRPESSYRPRRRTSSVDSNASERELWIRSSRKRSRSRTRDSLLRLKQRKYEEKKKKTFLEEIREKLNEVRSVPVVQYTHPTISGFPNPSQTHPIPAPVPAPNQFFPQTNPAIQQYDQSFFIGDTYPVGPTQNVNFSNIMGNAGNVVSQVQVARMQGPQITQIPIQNAPKLPVPVVQQNASISPKFPVQNENVFKLDEQKDKQTADDIDKLFADKKISLSDFLTITAKYEVQSSSPEHVQKKIKVISRCQDAIKAMSDDRKFTGRLSVKPSGEPKNKPELKYQSPLRRIPIVRFQFTSPAKASEEVDTFAAALDKILQKIGVLKETIDLEDTPDSFMKFGSGSSFADEDTSALSLKASLLGAPKKTLIDTVNCEECKRRKLKVFSDVGSQCADVEQTISIGIQVSEEDLSPAKALLKNESIAYLTPAQLLGKEKEASPSPAVVTNDKKPDQNKVVTETVPPNKKEKVKVNFKGRGGYRKPQRDRSYNFDCDEFEFFNRGRLSFEDSMENFGQGFSSRIPPTRYPAHFIDNGQSNMVRMNQLREDDVTLFTDFEQPYRGRNPTINRFGPRY